MVLEQNQDRLSLRQANAPPTWLEGSNPAGTRLNPAAVQFCLGRLSLSLSPWQPARAATTATRERRTTMKSCILPRG